MKTFTVFSKQLANKLCKQGFNIVQTDINNEKPWLYVYYFEDSEELQEAIQSYRSKRRYRTSQEGGSHE